MMMEDDGCRDADMVGGGNGSVFGSGIQNKQIHMQGTNIIPSKII